MIIRDDRIVAAGALLPLAETSIHTERFGTRHRAALGITEQTDAVVVVVSEENGQISLVERARIVRNLTEAGLARAIQGLLDPAGGRRGAFGWRSAGQAGGSGAGRRDCASSAASSGVAASGAAGDHRPGDGPARGAPRPRAASADAARDGCRPPADSRDDRPRQPPSRASGAGQSRPSRRSTSSDDDVVAPAAARAPR